MITDIQRGSLLKRISAAILDFICISILSVGFMLALSAITNFDSHSEAVEAKYTYYEEVYEVNFNLTNEEYAALTETEKKHYADVQEIINKDTELIREYSQVVNLTQLIATFGLLLGVMVIEFVVPLLLKNGQTLGKKIFSLAVCKTNGVRIKGTQLLARSLLGKYTVELMLPVEVLILTYFNVFGSIVLYVLIAFCILQMILYFFTHNRTPIHDLLAYTVVVDMSGTMLFDSEEALLKYKEEHHLEYVNSLKGNY